LSTKSIIETHNKLLKKAIKHARPPLPPAPVVPKLNTPQAGWVMDRTFGHNVYYPSAGSRVASIPGRYRDYQHGGRHYYRHRGVWYASSGGGYQVVAAPFGMLVSALPLFYTTVYVEGYPYYYAGGTYYRWDQEYRSYVVAPPPAEHLVSTVPISPDMLAVYPLRGQSREQQAKDRYQCHRWAFNQSGFDPTEEGGGVGEDEYLDRRDQYFDAARACLQDREYSVQ